MPPLTLADTTTLLSNLPQQPIRLGILGAPGTGKTFSMFTFPKCTAWNLDNKFNSFQKSFPELAKLIKVVEPSRELIWGKLGISNRLAKKQPDDPAYPVNIRDGYIRWLDIFGEQLQPGETLCTDSWSSLLNLYELQSKLPWEIIVNSKGEEDGWKYWGEFLRWCKALCEKWKRLRCNVVVTMHEVQERDEDDRLTGKLKPCMQGQFKDQFAGHLTDFYRQHAIPKMDKNGKPTVLNPGTPHEYRLTNDVEWFWQTQSDNIFNACCSIPGLPKFVKASYESLVKQPFTM